jgi:hypothetical protein
MLSSEEPLNLAKAKVGIELYAKMLYYLLQKSVAFGTWNMIGLYRTFMVIGISCLVRTGQKYFLFRIMSHVSILSLS